MTRLRAALFALFSLALLAVPSSAQYVAPYVTVQGFLTSGGGTPAQNATLTFQPSQVFFVAGTQVVVTDAQCATDTSGNVVSIGNPVTAPTVTPQFVGTLPSGNYYVKFTWYDQWGDETLPSPTVSLNLTSAGELHVTPPAGVGPPNAVGMNVYIGTVAGQETFQGHTTHPTDTFTQSTSLTTNGGTPHISNTTVCRVVANDAAWPTGTGYNVSLTDSSGNTLFSYPEMWQFFGPGSSYNLSQGIPYYHGQVTYPVPILTTPYNHNVQSIAGPLSMGIPGNYYPIYGVQALGVDTLLPAWGVDVEGTGLLGLINANGGYLVNGSAGSAGNCLVSDGTAYNTAATCLTSLPTTFYQTVINGSHATDAVTQEQYLAVGSGTGLTANSVVGIGSQVSRTVLNVNAFPNNGTISIDPYVVMTNAGGTSGQFACWDGTTGGIGASSTPCASAAQDRFGTLGGCTFPDDGGGHSCTAGIITWSPAFADTSYTVGCWPMYSLAIAGGSSTQPVIDLHAEINSIFQITLTEGVAQGSSGGFVVSPSYGLTIVCHAHHN